MPPKRQPASPPPDPQPDAEEKFGGDKTDAATSPSEPAAAPSPAPAPAAEPAPPPTVKGRWVGAEAVYNPQQGFIEPGDEIEVSREQLEDPNTPVIPLDEPWTRPQTQGSDS